MNDLQGLLVGFNLPTWGVFALYLVVTPLLPYVVIAPLLESRWLPVRFRDQFLTFTVGDVALAWFATLMTMNNRQSDYRPLTEWWVVAVAVVTVAIASVMTRAELKDTSLFAYAKRAVLSPTKLYHNIVLYAGYGWLLTMLLTQTVLQGVTWHSLLMLPPLLIWGVTMYIDGAWSSSDTKRSRAQRAHTANWKFAWQS